MNQYVLELCADLGIELGFITARTPWGTTSRSDTRVAQRRLVYWHLAKRYSLNEIARFFGMCHSAVLVGVNWIDKEAA